MRPNSPRPPNPPPLSAAPTFTKIKFPIISLLLFAWLFSGCTQQHPHEVTLFPHPTTARIVWQLGPEKSGTVASLALHPDGKHIVIGRSDGKIAIWTIGATKPDIVIPVRWNWVATVKISPDGKLLAWASINQPGRPISRTTPQAPLLMQVREWETGKSTDLPFEITSVDYEMQFSPDSKYLAALGNLPNSRLRVLDTSTLGLVLNHYDLNASGGPTFFVDAAGNLQLVALWQQWELHDSSATLKRKVPYADVSLFVRAFSREGKYVFMSSPPTFANERIGFAPWIVFGNSGIDVRTQEGADVSYLTFWGRGSHTVRVRDFIPDPRDDAKGLVIAQVSSEGKQDPVVVDISTHRYQSLLPSNWPGRWHGTCDVSVSLDGRNVAIGGEPGVVIWELP